MYSKNNMKNNFSHIICHYGEIGLKGRNRPVFEKQLIKNIKKSFELNDIKYGSINRISGRILIKNPKSDWNKIKQSLKNVFGIVNFSGVIESGNDIEDIKNNALNIVEGKEFNSFAIDTSRSDKSYPLNSQEINEQVGAAVVDKTSKDVDLDNPDLTIHIEIVENRAFVFLNKINGPGGLPVGTGGKAGILMSGGIDSPVASYLIAKRGVKPVFIHFHSYPHTSRQAMQKVKDLVKKVNKFTFDSTLYMVPFADIQKDIISEVSERMRIVFYRRVMMSIASKIAKEEGCQALVTGESVGQVASQTLENMRVISEPATLPILRPLVGMDKSEIISIAKKIDTFKLSTTGDDDTCTRFMPQNPITKAHLDKVRREEKSLDIKSIIEKGVTEAERQQIAGL